MKALSTTILVVVTAVVILVAALVLLTIFGTGISPVAMLSDERNSCITQASATCTATGQLPATWSIALKGGKSCKELTGNCDKCSCISSSFGQSETTVSGIRVSETLVNI